MRLSPYVIIKVPCKTQVYKNKNILFSPVKFTLKEEGNLSTKLYTETDIVNVTLV